MSTAESLAESVKAAISGGSATPSTVTTLQSLLSSAESKAGTSQADPKRTTTTTTKTTARPTKTTRPPAKGAKKDQAFKVLEDGPRTLSPKARYALATEIVNITLKVLTDATKPGAKNHRRRSSAQHHATPRTPSISQRALQVRSGNETPVTQSPAKQPGPRRRPSQCSIPGMPQSADYVAPTAECSRLGFAYLRSADVTKLGLREMPKLQLETGMLSLCGKMIALGLSSLAAKELRTVKRRFEILMPTCETAKSSRPASAVQKQEPETLSSLLQLKIDLDSCPSAWPLIITFHLHVLQVIAASHKPSTIEEILPHLEVDRASSPANMIVQQAAKSGDHTKAVKQLESLSRTILQLCPNLSSSADDTAKDFSRSPSPQTAFSLQVISLRVRREMWRLAGHNVDVEKDLADPFSRCLAAFVRRIPTNADAVPLYDVCRKALEALGLDVAATTGASNATFVTSRTLSTLAEKAVLHDDALKLAGRALSGCTLLGNDHARFVAALVRKSSILLSPPSSNSESEAVLGDLETITESLRKSLSGSASDYGALLLELLHLVTKRTTTDTSEPLTTSQKRLAGSAAGFASSYVRSLPGKNLEAAQEIIRVALTQSGSNEGLLGWVNKDAAQVLIQFGVLRKIAEKLSSRSIDLAWSCSSSAMALGRIVKLVVLRAAGAPVEKCLGLIIDAENLDPDQRGALLEWQLRCALELAHKSKYQPTLQKLLPECLRRLAKVYDADSYPLRRARVATQGHCIREQHSELLAPHALAAFTNASLKIDDSNLANDAGLFGYLADIKASLTMSVAFQMGRPTVGDLRVCVLAWQTALEKASDVASLELCIDSLSAMQSRLTMLDDYFEMMGDDESRLLVAQLLRELMETDQYQGSVRLARAYLSLGHAEKASEALSSAERTRSGVEALSMDSLDLCICKAELSLATDNLDKCEVTLERALHMREQMSIRTSQNRPYRVLHGRAWLLSSQYMLARGSGHDSLRAAKKAMKILNSIWTGMERSSNLSESQAPDPEVPEKEPAMDALTTKVSKLNLKPQSNKAPEKKAETKGAAFWAVSRLMCQTLTNLATVYAHHGVFNESNYSSEQAVKIAECVGSQLLLSRVRYHRSTLLAAAGRIEEAELCLAHDPHEDGAVPNFARVEFLRAKAALSVKIGDIQEARDFLEQAQEAIQKMQSESGFKPKTEDAEDVETQHRAGARAPRPTPSSRTANKSRAGGASRARTQVSKTAKKPAAQAPAVKKSSSGTLPYMLRKLEAAVILDKAAVAMKLGRPDETLLKTLEELAASISGSFKRRQLEHESIMRKVLTALQTDFSFNVLPESTLSFPALQVLDRRLSAQGAKGSLLLSPILQPPAKVSRPAKGGKKSNAATESLAELLSAARRCFALETSPSLALSTAEAHRQYSLMAKASMVLSATSSAHASNVLHPVREALSIDYGRLNASANLSVVAQLDKDSHSSSDGLAWPEPSSKESSASITAKAFRDEYIDLMPKSWTAVSMCLNEDCDELYIARYRSSQPPLILRLPFSRQKTDDADEEVFDFHMGKEELKDIIELSNYSCHNSIDTSVKGAKTNWWSEREALDRRLQELLINIENIWFGGFRGVFSQHRQDEDQLAKFRKAFEAILDRHLPSRKAMKRGSKKLPLDDQVLELFIGLGSDQDGEIDLDEPLADLLYFVVDIFQFNGERNAYDEIDFDSMAIDVLDALRTYYEAVEDQANNTAHLILVLDRRLQAFPWESMPSLEKSSVSRVDSMLTLKDRLVEMRRQSLSQEEASRNDGCYEVSRQSGSYILNPSADLKSTETMLAPELSKLAASNEACWTSIVRTEPSEDDFRSALTTRSMLLYFGHGAGSQYIRPRAIRRLDKCSEVVWLMGCSSGAVTEYDELEAFAVPLAYLVAGQTEAQTSTQAEDDDRQGQSKCMAIVATLWDVTDKDIDRFSLAVGEEWGLWKPTLEATKLPAKTPRKREKIAAPSTPERTAKTPKTPKVKKTPAPARTPARSRSRPRSEGVKKQSLVEAVAKSRDACYLRYLNGAAPVVYGVPVYLGD